MQIQLFYLCYVDPLLCNATCKYENISEQLMHSSNLTQSECWNRARIFSPCTMNYTHVSS